MNRNQDSSAAALRKRRQPAQMGDGAPQTIGSPALTAALNAVEAFARLPSYRRVQVERQAGEAA